MVDSICMMISFKIELFLVAEFKKLFVEIKTHLNGQKISYFYFYTFYSKLFWSTLQNFPSCYQRSLWAAP